MGRSCCVANENRTPKGALGHSYFWGGVSWGGVRVIARGVEPSVVGWEEEEERRRRRCGPPVGRPRGTSPWCPPALLGLAGDREGGAVPTRPAKHHGGGSPLRLLPLSPGPHNAHALPPYTLLDPPRGLEWVGGFEGKGYITSAEGPGTFFPPYVLPCVGQSVSEWVPLKLTPPPSPWGLVKCCGQAFA